MARPVTLFTGQWADLPLEVLAQKAKSWGYDGLELACWGDHFDVAKALTDDKYCKAKRALLDKYGMKVFAISNHLVGQCICDNIDQRHKSIVGPEIWGDGDPEGVRQRAAQNMIDAARAAKKLGVGVVNGFTGSSIWHLLYSFPPVSKDMIDAGYADFAKRFKPILKAFKEEGIKFGLEVHPTEIAFDIASAQRAIDAVRGHECFGFNYDASRNVTIRTGARRAEPAMSRALRRANGRLQRGKPDDPGGPLVFISYSHRDKAWEGKLVRHLAVLKGVLQTWDDAHISAGHDWRSAIERAMHVCQVAILMISPDFLASPFICDVEVVRLLRRREREGLVILPVIVRPCAWDCIPWLSHMMVRPTDGRPISTSGQVDTDFSAIAREVCSLVGGKKSEKVKEAMRVRIRAPEGPVDCPQVAEAVAHLIAVLGDCCRSGGGAGFDVDLKLHYPGKETYGGN